ncbi:hypothetical protein EDE08_105325 [Bradyrhizobium sp. R2.2-H]|jgi:hypothetical protein|nr:hypothetical protein EDE10_105325 [Bradyrhizobium sp. Y-H1]TCU74585.1 hypothetical protein EDE08_105325 [Bradyrhizobium sp. R2.2-H]
MVKDVPELEHRSPREVEREPKRPLETQSVPMIRELKDHPSAKAFPANDRLQVAAPDTVVADRVLRSGTTGHNGFRNFVFAYARGLPARVCAVVPDGTTEFTRALIFFHPLPTPRAGYDDGQYADQTGGWHNIYRYCEQQGAQLAASNKKIVLIMPIFSLASTETCGVFPDKWKDLIELILRHIRDQRFPGRKGEDMDLKEVITASYSAGVQYMSTFLNRAKDLKPALKEVWDYDGRFSTSREKSEGLRSFAPKVLTYDQRPVKLNQVVQEFRLNKGIHIPLPRWQDLGKSSSFLDVADPNVAAVPGASLFVHGAMPRYLMFHSLMQSSVG